MGRVLGTKNLKAPGCNEIRRLADQVTHITREEKPSMQGPSSLAPAALALLLAFSVLGNSGSAPQRLFERRNWTPQAMLYLKGAQGRRFISDQSRRKDLSDRLPPERRSPNIQLLTLPEVVALLLASLRNSKKVQMDKKTLIEADSWKTVC